jgi:hypothetical protein
MLFVRFLHRFLETYMKRKKAGLVPENMNKNTRMHRELKVS